MTTDLNGSQQRAVDSWHALTVVLANPGSGKTRVIVERIRKEIERGTVPSRIACITFTNAAADEIKSRLASAIGYVGTVHGFMLRLLRQHGSSIGLWSNLSVIDEESRDALMAEVLETVAPKVKLQEAVAAITNPSPRLWEGGTGLKLTDTIVHAYFSRLIQSGLLDYDAVLSLGLRLVQTMGPRPWPGIDLLLVDEAQDTGPVEQAIYGLLPVETLFVVGDPDQSIYGFRGANPGWLSSMYRQAGAGGMILAQNYRSQPVICRAASELISHNRDRVGKVLEPVRASGEQPQIAIAPARSAVQEALWLVGQVSGNPPGTECAVLARTNALAASYAEALKAAGVQVRTRKGKEAPKDWRLARLLVGLLANPDNDHLACQFLLATRGKRSAEKAKLDALKAFQSINRHLLHVPDDVPVEAVGTALAKAGIGAESIDIVARAQAGLQAGATMLDLAFAIGSGDLFAVEEGTGVTVTTLHAAKGREWDVVYLPAWEEGTVPLARASETGAGLAEERRLAFVGITRARDRVLISWAAERPLPWGKHELQVRQPSRFIAEAAI